MTQLHLFDAVGIEVEYMIVDHDGLKVRPFADRILAGVNGGVITSEVDLGVTSWSNELVSHVIELKTTDPVKAVDGDLMEAFANDIRRINGLLKEHDARLLPTAMHPLMDPLRETVLWPHDYSPVYQAYDRIFGCKGHGWSNLQSLHLNFPFCGDEEFGRLHAAVRLMLPLLPALAAASPMVDGRLTPELDHRLEAYRTNSRAIPTVVGEIVPEPVFDQATYDREIFGPMFEQIAPQDPEGILRDEFLNARGAIARFGRGSIEIRVIDVQECPRADLAIAAAVTSVLRLWVDEVLCDSALQRSVATGPLASMLRSAAELGPDAVFDHADYLRALGLDPSPKRAGDIWRHLIEQTVARGGLQEPWTGVLDDMLSAGPVAARIRKALGNAPNHERIVEVYQQLADCLARNELFRP